MNLSPHVVVEVRIDDEITLTSAPGLVLRGDDGLVGLQIIGHGQKSRTWTSLVARRLPDGSPSAWIEDAPGITDADVAQRKAFAYDAIEVTAIVGPFVSVHYDRHFGEGDLCLAGPPLEMMLRAPAGAQSPLADVVGPGAVEGVMALLDPPIQPFPGQVPRGHLGWDAGADGRLDLRVGAYVEGSSPTGSMSPREVPALLKPYLTLSAQVPTQIGQPGACATVGLHGDNLRVQRHGEERATELALPKALRGARFLGATWIGIDDPWSLTDLPPSGHVSDAAVARSIAP